MPQTIIEPQLCPAWCEAHELNDDIGAPFWTHRRTFHLTENANGQTSLEVAVDQIEQQTPDGSTYLATGPALQVWSSGDEIPPQQARAFAAAISAAADLFEGLVTR